MASTPAYPSLELEEEEEEEERQFAMKKSGTTENDF